MFRGFDLNFFNEHSLVFTILSRVLCTRAPYGFSDNLTNYSWWSPHFPGARKCASPASYVKLLAGINQKIALYYEISESSHQAMVNYVTKQWHSFINERRTVDNAQNVLYCDLIETVDFVYFFATSEMEGDSLLLITIKMIPRHIKNFNTWSLSSAQYCGYPAYPFSSLLTCF
jgi:hypothetical protein